MNKEILKEKIGQAISSTNTSGNQKRDAIMVEVDAYIASQFSSSQPFGIKYMEGLLIWVRDNHIQFTDGEWYHTDDKDGDHPMSESNLVEQYTKLNPTSSQPCEGREVYDHHINQLVAIRNYFGEHDKTPQEHAHFFSVGQLIECLSRTTLPVQGEGVKEKLQELINDNLVAQWGEGEDNSKLVAEHLFVDQKDIPKFLESIVSLSASSPLPPIAEEKVSETPASIEQEKL